MTEKYSAEYFYGNFEYLFFRLNRIAPTKPAGAIVNRRKNKLNLSISINRRKSTFLLGGVGGSFKRYYSTRGASGSERGVRGGLRPPVVSYLQIREFNSGKY